MEVLSLLDTISRHALSAAEVKDQTRVRILETHNSRKALAANLNFGMGGEIE